MKRTLGYSNIMSPFGFDPCNPFNTKDFYIEYLRCSYHEMLTISQEFLYAALSNYGLQDTPVSSWNIQLEMDGSSFTIDHTAGIVRPDVYIYGYNVDFHNRQSIKVDINGDIVDNFLTYIESLHSLKVPKVQVAPFRVDCQKELNSLVSKVYKSLAGQLINAKCDSDNLLKIIGLAISLKYGDDPNKIIDADSKPLSDDFYQVVFSEYRSFMLSENNEPDD